ncbi:MAG: FtsW/RodA/SpoVE family cell cycle protein, partial [Candidatus Jacksonbacteria bacterium]|nr:FtsW/RodA/SpoVE family cell cycle protein [Candidatus Jacksonbacteria bacterium]
ALVSLGMYVLAQAPWRQIFSMVGLGFGLLLVAIRLEPYRLSRVLVFLNPGTDPQGIGYQLTQALLAVGTGGLWGLGLGRSVQKYAYLPEVIGDSIFAIIAEELGFFLTVGVLALFAILVYRGILIARNAPDNFGRLLAAGITLWIGFQAFINIGAMIGILPLTGLPLPFMSFGNTALVSMLISMGLLLNISRQTR